MKPTASLLAVPLLAAALLSGCAAPEHQSPSSTAARPAAMAAPSVPAEVVASPYQEAVTRIADSLHASLVHKGIRRMPLGVSPFWDLQAPGHTETFGRELGELFLHALQRLDYNVVDHRPIPVQSPSGKPVLAKMKRLYEDHGIMYLVTGSYAQHPDQVVVHARILDTQTMQVVASGQAGIPRERLEGSLPGYNPLSSQRGMIVERGGVPVDVE